jgi:hypothetical protein
MTVTKNFRRRNTFGGRTIAGLRGGVSVFCASLEVFQRVEGSAFFRSRVRENPLFATGQKEKKHIVGIFRL